MHDVNAGDRNSQLNAIFKKVEHIGSAHVLVCLFTPERLLKAERTVDSFTLYVRGWAPSFTSIPEPVWKSTFTVFDASYVEIIGTPPIFLASKNVAISEVGIKFATKPAAQIWHV